MTRRIMPIASLVAFAVLIMALAATFGGAAAQDDAAELHPAHIHTGSCAELGDVEHPLGDLSESAPGGTPVAEASVGASSAHPVKLSITTIEEDLATLTGEAHAINVHESAEEIDQYIACGDIGGVMFEDNLSFGLGELNDSGHVGVATLTDNGDGTTTVTVALVEPGEMGDATPAG